MLVPEALPPTIARPKDYVHGVSSAQSDMDEREQGEGTGKTSDERQVERRRAIESAFPGERCPGSGWNRAEEMGQRVQPRSQLLGLGDTGNVLLVLHPRGHVEGLAAPVALTAVGQPGRRRLGYADARPERHGHPQAALPGAQAEARLAAVMPAAVPAA